MTDNNQLHIFGVDTKEDLDAALELFNVDQKRSAEIAKFGVVFTSTKIDLIPTEVWENLLLNRHFKGDWGDQCPEDKATNDRAYKGEGHWILSVYKNAYEGKDIWIETHGYGIPRESMDLEKYSVEDYNHTVVMFPEER
jgi:hypothetical protein